MKDLLLHNKRQQQTEALIQKLIAAIDEMISMQLSIIIQSPPYKRLESLWRGLFFMLGAVSSAQKTTAVRVRILDLSWSMLAADLELNARSRPSLLYRLVCRQELNTLGGQPFGLLLVDHAVSVLPDINKDCNDIEVLKYLANFAKNALCPVILPVASDFLGTDDIDIWVDEARVKRILDSTDFFEWHKLRKQENSFFLGLTLPEILMRQPWENYCKDIYFNEVPTKGMGSDYLWGNSAFAFARNVISEFDRIRWFGFLREPLGGAVVANNTNQPIAARLRITESLEYFYNEQGFIPLTTCYLTHHIAFFSNQSIFKLPMKDADKDQWKLLTMLQTTLTGCRFGHYLKKLIRENIGSYRDAESCELKLNEWLLGYVSNVGYAEESILAQYPLKSAKVRLTGDPNLGIYQCKIEIQPQYQFDMIKAHIVIKANAGELKPLFLNTGRESDK
ncbi:MAG: type VI secretion system contractile sheath large subunit [Endozoicomonas sp. (ex Botrylloides leachii)]|nr:type VI secretion system contractile sheath large subunit [Endozoicomonas sp. (ex Botrylloides leachii)]